MRYILGSQSPRRREILSYFDLPFERVSPDFDEDAIAFSGDPAAFACHLSKGKADSLAHRFPETLILTADTIVYLDGKSYAKPKDPKDAFATLSALSGKWHSVYTAVTLKKGMQEFSKAEETKVLFNKLTDSQIEHYIKTQSWADKAGGYGIQQAGGLLIHSFEGCYYNVVGLPINTVYELFLHFDIDLWQHLKPQG